MHRFRFCGVHLPSRVKVASSEFRRHFLSSKWVQISNPNQLYIADFSESSQVVRTYITCPNYADAIGSHKPLALPQSAI
jgi:hypothetical protein